MHLLLALMKWIGFAAAIGFWASLLILLPLSTWRRARTWTGLGIVLASYAVGAFTLLWAATVTLAAWGWWTVIVCVLLIGLPLVPVGFCALGFHFHQWADAWWLAGCLGLTFAMRIAGAAISEHGEDEQLNELLRQDRLSEFR